MSAVKKPCNRRGEFVLYEGCDWTAREEVALLEAIEHYGLGNWEDVSKLIGTRSPQEAFNHFEEAYVTSNIGDESLQAEPFGKVNDNSIFDINSSIDPLTDKQSSRKTSATSEEQTLMAYLPLRDDFELDHDNAAEVDIADLSPFGDPGCFDIEQHSLEFDLKVAQIHMFRRRLKERQRRHTVAHEYSVISEFFREIVGKDSSASTSKSTASAKKVKPFEPYCKKAKVLTSVIENPGRTLTTSLERTSGSESSAVLPFLQTVSELEAHTFVTSLQKEQKLRSEIRCLQYFRKRGFKTLQECGEAMETESIPEITKEFKQQVEKEFSIRSPRKLSSEGSGSVKSCENGHDLLSKAEEEFCSLYALRHLKYQTIKASVIKKIGEGSSFDEVRNRYRDKEGMNAKIVTFLQANNLVPSANS
ncbi:transcriptional adapter 2-beta-like [Convolutriloba macropyga]|uniref:transcriptional adapter 2-beta-like n=1 Tax=Convolutriloba macropyga TaxID=536237 RepID=UPI003F521DC1